MATVGVFLVVATVLFAAVAPAYGAGYEDGRESCPQAQRLHLNGDEQPRHGAPPGPW